MIDVVFMKNNDEFNKIIKTPKTVLTVQGNYKNPANITDITLTVNADLIQLTGTNYMHIPILKRYYYISNVTSVRNGLCEIVGTCDLLMSFSAEILANTAIVKRQQNKWNLYLNDGSFMTYQNPRVVTKNFPNGFNSFSYVLAVAGK